MNIILIISDTFRYDNLFDRAAMPIATPELDAFHERAVSVSGMHTASFPTVPQRTDTTTGRYGWPWQPWQDRLLGSPNHIPDILRNHGYVSQLICDCPHLFKASMNVGFDGAHVTRGQEGDVHLLHMNDPIEPRMPAQKTRHSYHFQGRNLPDLAGWTNSGWKGEADRFAPTTARLTIEWLEHNYQFNPFFLWVDFFDPHEPWDPPEYMVRKYDDYGGQPMIHPNYGWSTDLSDAELHNLRAHYAAEVQMVDRWIGRIFQKLDDLDLWNNSIVLFTSDHGISLGDHERTGKSNINPTDDRCWPLYPEIARVPWLVAAPGLEGGREVDLLMQPPDTLPTLLELAGVDAAPPDPFHGVSVAPHLRGESQDDVHDFVITAGFVRAGEGKLPASFTTSTGWVTPMLYTKNWAYAPIGANVDPELYDLTADPTAENDVAADHPDVVRELQDKLLGWLRDIDAPPEAISVYDR